MRIFALLLVSFALPALAELDHEEYERRLAAAAANAEAVERRNQLSMEEDLARRGPASFVFLKRDGDGPFRSLASTHFGLGQRSCRMSDVNGTIDAGSHFQMRALGGGEFEIIPKAPKTEIRLPSFQELTGTPRKKPRWKIKKNFNGTFNICSADGSEGPVGCNEWTIATVEDVDTTVFIRGRGDRQKIDGNDLTQGNLGTCTLWAAVHAVLEARGPEEIEKLFSPTQVTFPGKEPIPVGNQFLFYWNPRDPHSISPIGAEFGDTDERGRRESWPVLLEKAYTIWKRSLMKADSGGLPESVLSLVTNETVKPYYFSATLRSQDNIFDCLKAANDEGRPMVCGSRSEIKGENPYGIVTSHAYAIKKVNEGDKRTVVVIDPHGKTIELPLDEFFKHFSMAAHTTGEKGPIRQAFDAQVDKVWR